MTLSVDSGAVPDPRTEALEALIQAASEFMAMADYTVERALEDDLLAALDQAHQAVA